MIASLSPFVIVTVIESVVANDFFFKSEAIFAVASQFEKRKYIDHEELYNKTELEN